jgi:hypothetical protein
MDKQNSDAFYAKLFGFFVVVGLIGGILYIFFASSYRRDVWDYALPLLCGPGIGLIIAAIIGAIVESSRCPNCGAAFTKEDIAVQEMNRSKGYRTILRQETNNKGEVVRSWNEQIRVLNVAYLHTHQCSQCKHQWTSTSVAQFDTFDD